VEAYWYSRSQQCYAIKLGIHASHVKEGDSEKESIGNKLTSLLSWDMPGGNLKSVLCCCDWGV